MRRCSLVILVLLAMASELCAGTLTPAQRQDYMYRAVQMLQGSSGISSAQPQKGVFRVKARRYYDNSTSRYVVVKKITAHEYRTWANEQTEWNSGRSDELELRLNYALVGKDYQVRVEWEDGETYTWEYSMKQGGTTVVIDEPR